MGIFDRISTILKANINEFLDHIEDKDPVRVVDQKIIELKQDLADVKKETAGVRHAATTAKKRVSELETDISKYDTAIKNAAVAATKYPGDAKIESDVKELIAKKQNLENQLPNAKATADVAEKRASDMTAAYEKLGRDIEALESKRATLKANVATAKILEKSNGISKVNVESANDAIDRISAKVDERLGIAEEVAAMNADEAENSNLVEKYASAGTSAVDDEFARVMAEAKANA